MSLIGFDRAVAPAVLAAALAAAGAARAQPQEKPAAKLRTIAVKVAGHPLRVEVAESDPARARGLMYRQGMGRNEGMLFVFEDLGYHSMWMQNTYIPLSVAFIDAEGRILNILDMQPKTQETHTAAGPARYAIETNRGWFAEKKVRPGDRVTGLPKAP